MMPPARSHARSRRPPEQRPAAPASATARADVQRLQRTLGNDALQRAVWVCDEWTQGSTGAADPGPGIHVNVDRPSKRAAVTAQIETSGAESDAAKASTIQNTISSNWNGNFSDGFQVTTTPTVTHRPASQSENSSATQIEIERAARPSSARRHWVLGSQYMSLNLNESDALTWACAHEFGHLLGLSDRYSESIASKIRGLWGGERETTPHAGYENNIMAITGGVLESRNVSDLIGRWLPYTCTRGHMESPL
jgi:hypothetical protein